MTTGEARYIRDLINRIDSIDSFLKSNRAITHTHKFVQLDKDNNASTIKVSYEQSKAIIKELEEELVKLQKELAGIIIHREEIIV